MAYQALYRVYRPRKFSDVVGQEIITQTLRNAVKIKHASHAYLFTGPRGTGKTSCAKILAKAINCLHPIDGEPDNECSICIDANENRLNDIIEIDAASNNGVEEIRDIRDKVKYAPTQATYKVYIIDEVHMLSQGAFNALLKTLEEPPKNVVFILATTEPQKIPATIISRTQRFDFKRITKEKITDRLEFVLKEQNIPYDNEAVGIISMAAEGGMRDALSIMDQAISFSNNGLELNNVLEVTGALRNDQLINLFNSFSNADVSTALQQLKDILNDGRSAMRLTESIITMCRDLIMVQSGNNNQVSNEAMLSNLIQIKDNFTQEKLFQIIDIVSDTQKSLKNSNQVDVYLEVMIVKICNPIGSIKEENVQDNSQFESEINQLKNEINKLKEEIKQHNVPIQKVEASNNRKKQRNNKNALKFDKPAIFEILAKAKKEELLEVRDVWRDLLSMLEIKYRAIMNISSPVAASNDGVVVAFDYAMFFQEVTSNESFMEELTNNLSKLLKKDIKIVLVSKSEWPTLRKEYINQHASELKHSDSSEDNEEIKPVESEVVAKAKDIFGTDILNIKKD